MGLFLKGFLSKKGNLHADVADISMPLIRTSAVLLNEATCSLELISL